MIQSSTREHAGIKTGNFPHQLHRGEVVMIVLFALCSFHITTLVAGAAEDDFNPLGMGVYLPSFNLQGHLDDTGIQVCLLSCIWWHECTVHVRTIITA